MYQAAAAHRSNEVVEISERLVSQGFVNTEAHLMCAQACSELKKPEQSKFHTDVMTALLRSMLDAGNGTTVATAYEVISNREKYVVLAAMGLPYLGEGVSSVQPVTDGGRQYERWEVRNPKTQAEVVVFCNIDAASHAR